ncbi:hypothetical protein ACFY5J_27010 [Peribacillus butanolivorans]|uniref:hypothetical protein n=1 Tax=Peribacillus butanolivorans TaxID=421767 RepID=UPI0036A7B85F
MEEEKKPYAKTYKLGNTTVTVHSKLLFMSEEERDQWLKEQRAAGNPDLLTLERIVNEAYRKFY